MFSRNKQRRVRQFNLSVFGKSWLSVKLRYFKTQKRHRSKLKRQLVIPLRFFRAREIAIYLPGQRSAKTTPAPRQALLPAFLIIFGLAGIGISASNLSTSVNLVPTAEVKAAPPPETEAAAAGSMTRSAPVRLRVPKIGLSAEVTSTTIGVDGKLRVPPSGQSAAWYDKAPSPGEIGPSVIVGHVHMPSGPAVFWRLRELQLGDIIEVARKDNTTVKFKVIQIAQYDIHNFPSKNVYGNIDYPGIRLITCGGKYDYSVDHYTQNTVVYGAMVSQKLAAK